MATQQKAHMTEPTALWLREQDSGNGLKKKQMKKRKQISINFWDIANFVRDSKESFKVKAYQDGNRKYEFSATITLEPEASKEYLLPIERLHGATALHLIIEKERFTPIGPVEFHGLKFFIH